MEVKGTESPSHRATKVRVVPWSSTDVSTIKNTKLNIMSAFGTPAMSGKVAKTIGAAPRKPTHETNNFSLTVRVVNINVAKTLAGRATNIKNKERITPTPMMGRIFDGKT